MSYTFWHAKGDDAPIRIPAIGLDLFVRLPASASGGDMEVIECINAPGFGPPLHRHAQTEVFRVLEGRYLYECDGTRFVANTGEVVCIPGGAVHAFCNLTDAPARQIISILPKMDAYGFFTGLGEILANGVPSPDEMNRFALDWQVEFLGPPIKPDGPA